MMNITKRPVDIDFSKPVVTLGPSGTDSEHAARHLTDQIRLVASFEEAMETAYREDLYALVCCGYKRKQNGVVVESWVDLNFRYLNRLEVMGTYSAPTKPMCIARNRNSKQAQSMVIHPSTEEFLSSFPHITAGLKLDYVNNKPSAVQMTARGEFDLCIGSLDVVHSHPELEVLEVFQPQMVWSVYHKSRT